MEKDPQLENLSRLLLQVTRSASGLKAAVQREPSPSDALTVSQDEASLLRQLSTLLQSLSSDVQAGTVPKELHQETESWLDKVLPTLEQFAPMLLEQVPKLLALL
jgi:hypothetical protein